MTLKLEAVLDIRAITPLLLANGDVFNECNEVVSQFSHGLHKQKMVPGLKVEEIYEHLWMILAATLVIRATKYGNVDIIRDWVKVIEGDAGETG